MSLTEIYRGTRALEAIANYAVAGVPVQQELKRARSSGIDPHVYESERGFWRTVFNGRIPWGTTVKFYETVLSEWVGRVPGLYWTENAEKVRDLAKGAVEYISGGWKQLEPIGKSQKVMGGIGTLKFTPDIYDSYRLASFCTGFNASTGIPALISPEVWEHHHLQEGKRISSITAKWQRMSNSWAERFSLIQGIPKGFLVLEDPDDLTVHGDEIVPTLFHPCTVMEYSSGSTRLYDFVYATADTSQEKHRDLVKEFFEQYKNDKGRDGKYLLAADMDDSRERLWEAEFESPERLKRVELGARSQLELLEARVLEQTFSGENLGRIADLLAMLYDANELKILGDDIGVLSSNWYMGGKVANVAADLLAICLDRKKVDVLVDKVALVYPEAFAEKKIGV